MKLFPRRIVLPATAAALLAAAVSLPAQSNHRIAEQRHFSAEDATVGKPVPIPSAVMAILSQDELVRGSLDDEGNPRSGPPSADSFLASEVHLGESAEKDLVVIAGPPLAGSNVTTFWLFRMREGRPLSVLRTGGHDLIIEKSRSHGLAIVKTDAMTCCTLTELTFHFDGTRYGLARRKATSIR
ncbi:MAG TPA: hypothetical protein VIY53_00135 [Acidobacteriaceae bacterium]